MNLVTNGRGSQAMEPFTNLIELEERAKPLLPISVFGYYASGSECEVSVRENKAALARWRLLPRVLRDVSTVDTSCELFGKTCSISSWIRHHHEELNIITLVQTGGGLESRHTLHSPGITEPSVTIADPSLGDSIHDQSSNNHMSLCAAMYNS